MATYSTPTYTNKTPPSGVAGLAKATNRLHDTASVPVTMAANDIINVGYLPPGAIVTSAGMKAATQLDSNGSPTLAFDLGVTGTAQLFKAAVTTVGAAATASDDTTIAAAGYLYKNTTGADQLVIATVHTVAATKVAGTLEFDIGYFIEPTAGSQA